MADGPFAESKEAIGGYFYLRVADLDEAVRNRPAMSGPGLRAVVEVRPVADMCGARARALEQAARDGRLAVA